jgi:tetratricopeptide (TPR) repeat protein
MPSIEVVKNALFVIPAPCLPAGRKAGIQINQYVAELENLQVADGEQRAFSSDDASKRFNTAFGIPAANIALRLFMASAVSLPPDSSETLEKLNVLVDWLIGQTHGLPPGEALKNVSLAIRAIDAWEKSHRTSKVYDALDVSTQIKLAGFFRLRAQFTEQLEQNYRLVIDDLRNAVEINELAGRGFEEASLLEEIGDIERRNGTVIGASIDYKRAAAKYDKMSMQELRSRAAQKGGDLVTAIVALEEARKDIATALSQNKLSCEAADSDDRRLEAEIGYLEKVQDGTISYKTASGLGPLLPADFQTTKEVVKKTAEKFRKLDFATTKQQGATVLLGLVKEIDSAIEQAGMLGRYYRDMHFDSTEQLGTENIVAQLLGFGGRLSIAVGDFGNLERYYNAAAAIYLPTGQYIKGAKLSVQFAEGLANNGRLAEAQTYFMTAGEYYELAGKAVQALAEKMLALELAGDMYRRGDRDLQARQVYEEAVIIEAKSGEDEANLSEYRKRIVDKVIVVREKLVLRNVRANLLELDPAFRRLSEMDQLETVQRCVNDWKRLSVDGRGVPARNGTEGLYMDIFDNPDRDWMTNWLVNAKQGSPEANTVRGVEVERDRDGARKEGERPAAELRGPVEGRVK